MSNDTLAQGTQARHSEFGLGTVQIDNGQTVIIRFDHGLEECEKSGIQLLTDVLTKASQSVWDVPLQVINRVQALAIRSVNDMWGVFSPSQIELLPHQLWVCRRVNSEWPMRWMVADDVGLGKTIEAGMILYPLISRNIVRRLLIICPASLVRQWQDRLFTMFDIRLTPYRSDAAKDKSNFWEIQDYVVASLQTIRADDENSRHQERLLQAPAWDLVMVDEAHHLNADENTGYTLGYTLVKNLQEHRLVKSMVFFTGTPHRGKDFGFLALLHLLKPDDFDPRQPMQEQLKRLRDVMIRNNKASVTDLNGEKLFKNPRVTSREYLYTGEEQYFYDLMTEFIRSGRTYASSLSITKRRTAILVLIALQKIASSSVAAIRRALKNRLERIRNGRRKLQDLHGKLRNYEDDSASEDERSRIEAEIAEAAEIMLAEDEEGPLEELLEAANQIKEETKIKEIIRLVQGDFKDRSILFFTEYKATQSLVMSALMAVFGIDCVTFINGDNVAQEVTMPDGELKSLREPRDSAAQRFTKGKVRFLVSTEAAGEGIDLQESCYTLIHVDLPWNPMRMHQRVGRLNRYGQKERVDVISIRNPDTVESLIWEKLNTKIERINVALRKVMDDPEDVLELVLGMASPSIFQDLYTEAVMGSPGRMDDWFDQKTARFGGDDVIATVKDLVGNVSRFDFRKVAAQLPQVDVPDLRPFFETALSLNNRRHSDDPAGLVFITPDSWRQADPVIKRQYREMQFDRGPGHDTPQNLLGVGHRVMDQALQQAIAIGASLTAVPSEICPHPILVYTVRDRVTGEGKAVRYITVAIEQHPNGLKMLNDWRLLKLINSWPLNRQFLTRQADRPENASTLTVLVQDAENFITGEIEKIEHGFQYPTWEMAAAIWPH